MLMDGLAAVLGVVDEGLVLKDIITRHTLDQRAPAGGGGEHWCAARTPGVRGRVLIAEDNAVNQLIVERLLQRAGWTVVTVAMETRRSFGPPQNTTMPS